MQFFYSPGACSLGIHILLEEIGKPYQLSLVSLKDGQQNQAAFRSKNPKSKVPALELDDGQVLTEFPAIAFYLGAANPALSLLPTEPLGQARTLELMDFVVSTIHMRGFTLINRPGYFSPEGHEDYAKGKGREVVERGFANLADFMAPNDYAFGKFSIVDCAIFYVEFWARRAGLEMPARLHAHLDLMLSRPSVQAVLKQEGLAA